MGTVPAIQREFSIHLWRKALLSVTEGLFGWEQQGARGDVKRALTFCWSVKPDEELAHLVIHQSDLIVGHQPVACNGIRWESRIGSKAAGGSYVSLYNMPRSALFSSQFHDIRLHSPFG